MENSSGSVFTVTSADSDNEPPSAGPGSPLRPPHSPPPVKARLGPLSPTLLRAWRRGALCCRPQRRPGRRRLIVWASLATYRTGLSCAADSAGLESTPSPATLAAAIAAATAAAATAGWGPHLSPSHCICVLRSEHAVWRVPGATMVAPLGLRAELLLVATLLAIGQHFGAAVVAASLASDIAPLPLQVHHPVPRLARAELRLLAMYTTPWKRHLLRSKSTTLSLLCSWQNVAYCYPPRYGGCLVQPRWPHLVCRQRNLLHSSVPLCSEQKLLLRLFTLPAIGRRFGAAVVATDSPSVLRNYCCR